MFLHFVEELVTFIEHA